MTCTLLALLVVAAADDTPLAKQAMAVLRTHCGGCHGDGPAARAGLSVLDRDQLINLRRVVVPGRPQSSELVWLLDSGAMPPGTRPKPTTTERDAVRRWIEAGAPPEVAPLVGRGRGDDYILSVLMRDWALLPAEKRSTTRYVSLNHLLGPDRTAVWKELRRILGAYAPKGEEALVGLDEPASVHRLDLKALGWDRRPLRIAEERGSKPSPLTFFDLILLEYPYGYLAFTSPHTARALPALRQMEAVRPVPYVRGDWLAAVLTNPRFGPEFLALLGRGTKAPVAPPLTLWPERMVLERAVLELGLRGDAGRLKRALDDVGLQELPLGRVVPRRAWEMRFPLLVRKLELGTPIVPLDGVTVPDTLGDGTIKVTLTTSQARYFQGQDLTPKLTLSRDIIGRVLHLDPAGTKEVAIAREVLKPDAMGQATLGTAFTFGKEAVVGENHLTLLALPADAGEIPSGDLHVGEDGKRFRGRYVLRVYRLNAAGTGFEGIDASRIVKTTAAYEYAGAKK